MIRKSLNKNAYLIITAICLYACSFIFINYWRYDSSPKIVQEKLQKHIKKNEEQVNSILADTSLIASVLKKKEINYKIPHLVYSCIRLMM